MNFFKFMHYLVIKNQLTNFQKVFIVWKDIFVEL